MFDPDDDRTILQTEDVAELLQINVQMVRKYAREGQIPAYRLPQGRKYYFFREEVLDWLRAHPASDG